MTLGPCIGCYLEHSTGGSLAGSSHLKVLYDVDQIWCSPGQLTLDPRGRCPMIVAHPLGLDTVADTRRMVPQRFPKILVSSGMTGQLLDSKTGRSDVMKR